MTLNSMGDTINVVVIGNTGEGKSTLINAILNLNISMTGVGEPVTQEIFSYKVPKSQLRLFDTKGFEIESSQDTVNTVEQFINECSQDTDINKKVHCVWLCVSAQSHRWQPIHKKFVSLCSKLDIPCIVTITQSYGEYEQYVEFMQANVPENAFVIPLLAKALGLPDGSKIDAWGVSDLLKRTTKLGNYSKSKIAREKARLARINALNKISYIAKKTIGGTVAALGLLIVINTSMGFRDCGNRPGFWLRLTLSRSQYQAKIKQYKQCTDQNSNIRWIILISLSGSVFVGWYTFLRD
ncbi:MAG: GTPase domain-containing protein [Symploca sp. SIO3E6]|nr:GTPase domain-containing protein [Caldora sp. SIO3E6]